MKNRFLFWFCASFVLTAQISAVCNTAIGFLAAFTAILFVTLFLLCKNGGKTAAILVIIAALFSLFWRSYYISDDKFPPELSVKESEIMAEAVSYSESSPDDRGVNVDIKFQINGRYLKSRLHIANPDINISPGDVVSVKASFSEYEDNEYFAEKTYYKSRYIDVQAFADEAVIISKDEKIKMRYFPQYLAKAFKDMSAKLFSDEASSFLNALILSDTGGISDEVKEDLRATGLSHMMSVSGFHISFIVGLLLLLTKNKYLKLLFIPVIFLFALMVGFPQSALRAAIMQSLLLLSSALKREYDPLTALSFAGFLLVFINPYCATDIAFLLSFLSTFGIIVLYKKVLELFDKIISKVKGVFKKPLLSVFAIVAVSLSAMIFTAPILAISFNFISLISPLTNTILNVPITGVFTLGIVTVILGFLYFPLAKGVAIILEAIIAIIMNFIRAMARLPFSEFFVGNTTVIVFICFVCGVLIYSIAVGRKRIRLRVTATVIAAMSCILMLTFTMAPDKINREGIRFDIFDVGQGQCIVITRDDACVVIDCGGDKDASNIAISHILKNSIEDIDAMIITHAHSDHANGVRYLVDTVTTDKIYMPADDRENATFVKLVENIDKNCEAVFVDEDKQINIDGIDVRIITLPPKNDENEKGLVIIVSDGEYDFLVTGDIPSKSEKIILDKLPDCESYVVGHHGSKGSSSQALLNKVLPELCVISVGLENTYGHPSKETIKRIENIGASIERTDISGSLTFYSREVKFADDN